jgi:hypothetical protein
MRDRDQAPVAALLESDEHVDGVVELLVAQLGADPIASFGPGVGTRLPIIPTAPISFIPNAFNRRSFLRALRGCFPDGPCRAVPGQPAPRPSEPWI